MRALAKASSTSMRFAARESSKARTEAQPGPGWRPRRRPIFITSTRQNRLTPSRAEMKSEPEEAALGEWTPLGPITITPVAPGLFTVTADGRGLAAPFRRAAGRLHWAGSGQCASAARIGRTRRSRSQPDCGRQKLQLAENQYQVSLA